MKGYKTIIAAVVSLGLYIMGWEQLTQYLDGQTIAVITAVLMMVMRLVTSSPVGKKAL